MRALPMAMRAWPVFVALVFAVAGCGDDPDDTPESACATDVVVGTTFDLAPSAPLTQIHVDAAVGHGGVWLTYNLVDSQRGFDPVVAQVNCDGTERLAAMQLEDPDNEIDPAIAVSGETVALVWQADTATAQNNLQLRFASFDPELATITPAATFRSTRGGDAVEGNSLEAVIEPVGDGFAIAGLRSFPEATAFQGFVQQVSTSGVPVSDGIDVGFEADVGHRYVGVAAMGSGSVYSWWTRQPMDGDVLAAATIDLASGAVAPNDGLTGDPAASADLEVGSVPFVIRGTESSGPDMVLSTLDGSVTAELGMAGALDFTPRIAASGDAGIIAFYRNVSGFSNDLYIQSFSFDGAAFTLGPETKISTAAVPPYAPAIVHVEADVYFVGWSEGDSPDFVAKGRFVQPSPI